MPDEPAESAEQFISEELRPLGKARDTAAMVRREPGLPEGFAWRGTEYRIVGIIEMWKTSSPEPGGGNIYLRRHWYRVRTDPPAVMTIYFDRQAHNRKRPKARWWLYTMHAVGSPGAGPGANAEPRTNAGGPDGER